LSQNTRANSAGESGRGLHLDSQIGTTLDAGRRYGDSDQFGARVNLVHREGETGIPNDRRRTTLLSTGLDYKGDRFRTSLDLGYQKKTFHGSPTSVNISAVDFVPEPPKNDRNFAEVGLQQYRKRIRDVAQRVRHHRRLDGLYRPGRAARARRRHLQRAEAAG
jgi:hypothetical protein